MMSTDRVLERIYYDKTSAGYLGSIKTVWQLARRRQANITQRTVADWLRRQRTYTLHTPQRHSFHRAKTTGVGLHTHLQIDLANLERFRFSNSRYAYILAIIDCFSRQARAMPLKSKRATEVLAALRDALQSYSNTHFVIYADQGTEFEADVRRWLQATGINFVQLVNSPHKASMVERFIRTLKGAISRHMTQTGSKRWVDVLPQLVTNYNNRRHAGIGRTPNSITADNEEQVYAELYGSKGTRRARPRFAAGDSVRLRLRKHLLEKGYTPNFTEESYVVSRSVPGREPPVYNIKTMDGEVIRGVFYESELQNAGQETGPRRRR